MRVLKLLGCALLFWAGFAAGAYCFVQTQARPLPAPRQCGSVDLCLSDPEVLGLAASVGLHMVPGAMPDIIARSPECVGIRNPRPVNKLDLVFFPTHDLRNLLDLAPGDEKYVLGCFALMRQEADALHLKEWRIVSNGPGAQEITYLHFHLIQD
jgi:hypothetical protein